MTTTITMPPALAELVTAEDLQKLLTEEEVAEIEHIGRQRDQHHWTIGNRMYDKIDRQGWPAVQTATLYARLTHYNTDRRVREFYYCSAFYQKHPKLYVRFSHLERATWEVFNFARKCDDPEAVLTAMAEEGYSLSDLRLMFKPHEDETDEGKERPQPKYPIYVAPLVRWAKNRVKREAWPHVEDLIDAFLAHLRELTTD